MLQRLQSLYLFIAVIIYVVLSFPINFLNGLTNSAIVEFSSKGVIYNTPDKAHVMHTDAYPLFALTIALAVFTIWIIFLFKNLSKQLKMIKILWIIQFILIITTVVIKYILKTDPQGETLISLNYDKGFYLLIIALGFIHLAFTGINKDKKTIDSLNRLR